MEENKLKTIEGELEAPADFTSPDVLYRDLVASIRKYHPSDDLSMIEKAYQLADNAHKDQKRKSGEPYIIHPLCVAIDRSEYTGYFLISSAAKEPSLKKAHCSKADGSFV